MIKSFKSLLIKDLEPRYMQKVYELNGVMIVPHYQYNLFVGPGYGFKTVKTFSEEELIERGAKMTMYPLWAGGKNRSMRDLEKRHGSSKESSEKESSGSKANN